MPDGPITPAAHLIGIDSAEGSTAVRPIAAFEQDASYNDAKLVLEACTYWQNLCNCWLLFLGEYSLTPSRKANGPAKWSIGCWCQATALQGAVYE